VPHLRFLDSARDNLVEIAEYIAAVSGEDAAVRVTGQIVDKCEHLGTLTGLLGRARPELRPDTRHPLKNHLIFFRYLPATSTATFSRSSIWSKAPAILLRTAVMRTSGHDATACDDGHHACVR
jgi:plasmid stabilization system protein ParE